MATKKTILVTGGAGYIGSHTIIELLNNTNYDVISVDNYSNSSAATYDRIKAITGKTIKHYAIDLCNYDQAKKIFLENETIDGVIHFAAFKSVPESVAQPLKYYQNNVNSLINVLGLIKEHKVKRFIFSSSCSVYGNISQLPVSEDNALEVTQSPYAYTKVVGENVIKDFCVTHKDINAIALRYFNPVGAHSSGLNGELPINAPNNLVPVITQTAIGKIKSFTVFGNDYKTRDGSCVRDYVHVSDIANAHVLALDFILKNTTDKNYDLFNLGTGNGTSVLEAITAFEKVTGIKPNYVIGPRREGDVEAIYSDCTKANNVLGWKPKYDLESMMNTAWAWEKNINVR